MKKRNIFFVLVIFILTISMVACGSYNDYDDIAEPGDEDGGYYEDFELSQTASYSYNDDYVSEEAPEADYAGGGSGDEPVTGGGGGLMGGDESGVAISVEPNERKLVITSDLSLETKEFEKAVEDIKRFIEEHGGYAESSSISGQSIYTPEQSGGRYASFSARIPTSDRGKFLDLINDTFNVTSVQEYTSDITEAYYDTADWLKILEDEYDKVEALLDADGDLEYLFQVRTELSRLRHEINTTYTRIKNMDSQVDYSTIHLYLTEVVDYNPVVPIPKTFPQRISQAFSNSWKNFVRFFQSLLVNIVYLLPFIIILIVVIVVIVILTRKKKRKEKLKK